VTVSPSETYQVMKGWEVMPTFWNRTRPGIAMIRPGFGTAISFLTAP
jgi:hypothetical protein